MRRLSTAQRSDALFGQDTDVDSYYGYAGQIAWMDWKYLGEKEILGTVHAEHFPVKWDDKVDWAFDDNWEKRKVYVIEGTSKLPQYAYSKRVLFIDKETWGIPYSDIYDRSGELWKIWINDVSFRKSVPGNNAITYEDEMPFAPAIVMVDMQLEHATKASLPSPRFPGEQGWYFHQGEKAGITDDWFTVAALVAAGHDRSSSIRSRSGGARLRMPRRLRSRRCRLPASAPAGDAGAAAGPEGRTFATRSGFMSGALSRFRMLDLSRQLPGPFCSMLLADLGMDVLTIYAPTDPMGMGIPLLGRNKRSLTLNLKQPDGQAIFHAWCATRTWCSRAGGPAARRSSGRLRDAAPGEPAARLLLDLRLRAGRARTAIGSGTT